MKRFFLFVVMAMAVSFLHADGLNDAQIALRTEIMRFLSEEGYMPNVDKDGDIAFKKEGSTYYVQIDPKNENPMYLTLSRYFNYPESYSKEMLILASAEINLYKAVKLLLMSESYVVQAEMFLVDADTFKYSFYKLMDIIQSASGKVLEECENAKNKYSGVVSSAPSIGVNIPFVVDDVSVGISDKDGNMVIPYGNTLYSYNTKYLKPKVTVTPHKSGTFKIYIRLYKNNNLCSGTTSPEGYTYSKSVSLSGSSKQYLEFSGWGSNNAGFWEAGSYRFEFWYEGFCLGSKDFKVY